MNRYFPPGSPCAGPRTVALGALVVLVFLTASPYRCIASDAFQDLVNQVPRSANAIVLLNMDKAKSSPLGLKENWSAKVEQAFESGLVRVPPQARRFVLASQIDFEFMEPIWDAAVIELDEDLSMKQIEKMRRGTLDTIEGLPAIERPNDTYLIKLAPKTIGAMAPANRQMVVRWIRDVRKPTPLPLSSYLQKAADYSDKAGSEIIMAMDLDGVFSYERVAKYLKSKQDKLDQWGADLKQLTRLLESVQGVRIGVRIGEALSGKIVIDVQGDASTAAAYAKPLLLDFLADRGSAIEDFQSWTAKAEGHEISLAGKLSAGGLRRLMSVVDAPTSETPLTESPVSPGELPALQAKASIKHYRAVTGMADDLKSDMKNAKNIASASLWLEKYAKRIERLPILNVDSDLLNYSAFVAQQLRKASMAVRTMGIQSGARQSQVISTGTSYGYGATRWGNYGAYGGFGPSYGSGYYSDATAEVKAIGAERRAIRAEEKGIAATDVQQIRQAIIGATADIRRKMTLKYQIEF